MPLGQLCAWDKQKLQVEKNENFKASNISKVSFKKAIITNTFQGCPSQHPIDTGYVCLNIKSLPTLGEKRYPFFFFLICMSLITSEVVPSHMFTDHLYFFFGQLSAQVFYWFRGRGIIRPFSYHVSIRVLLVCTKVFKIPS